MESNVSLHSQAGWIASNANAQAGASCVLHQGYKACSYEDQHEPWWAWSNHPLPLARHYANIMRENSWDISWNQFRGPKQALYQVSKSSLSSQFAVPDFPSSVSNGFQGLSPGTNPPSGLTLTAEVLLHMPQTVFSQPNATIAGKW